MVYFITGRATSNRLGVNSDACPNDFIYLFFPNFFKVYLYKKAFLNSLLCLLIHCKLEEPTNSQNLVIVHPHNTSLFREKLYVFVDGPNGTKCHSLKLHHQNLVVCVLISDYFFIPLLPQNLHKP